MAKVVTVAEAAKILGVTRQRVYVLAREGRIKGAICAEGTSGKRCYMIRLQPDGSVGVKPASRKFRKIQQEK